MFLPLLVTPILSRLYTPSDYGDWGIFSSVLYIVGSFVFLSYENTIVKTNDEHEVSNLFALCVIILAIVSLSVLVIFKVGAIIGIGFFKSFPSFPLLIPVIVSSALFTLSSNLGNRLKKYNAMAVSNVVNGTSQAVFRIVLGIFPIVSYGLIVGNLLAQLLAAITISIWVRDYFSSDFFTSISWERVKRVARKYKKFPLFDAPARFIEFAIGNLAIILLSFFWPKDEVGCFSMVIQFVLIPITIIGSAMGNVYYREISENAQNQEQLIRATIRVGKICFVLSLLPILFLAMGGDQLFAFFLGDRWDNVAPMSLCMVLFSVPVILSEPLLPIFRTLERQEIRFRINAINFVSALGVLALLAFLTHSLYLSLIGYSLVYAVSRFIMFHNELKLVNVDISMISKFFVILIIGCYVLVAIRILFILFLV